MKTDYLLASLYLSMSLLTLEPELYSLCVGTGVGTFLRRVRDSISSIMDTYPASIFIALALFTLSVHSISSSYPVT